MLMTLVDNQAHDSRNLAPSLMSAAFDTSFDVFNFDFETHAPTWLVDEDFHAGLFDTPLVNAIAELQPDWLESPDATKSQSDYNPAPSTKRLWFTPNHEAQEDVPPSGPATPPATQMTFPQIEVDDHYRRQLHQSLQIRQPSENTLPSADFLNLCVRSYFARFHPVFPIVHLPTFRPSKSTSMLLLSICSVGSLFTGSIHAVHRGVQIFERLHKAVLANWDRLISRGAIERISLIQTAIIGQTFGLLSGEPKHLAIVDAFNGALISWARRLGTFKTKKMTGLNLHVSAVELENLWREWAQNEELIRIALSVHIHDAELFNIFHHESFLRHNSRLPPVAASNQIFMASKVEDWRAAYLNDPSNFDSHSFTTASIDPCIDFDLTAIPSNSCFTAYTVLQGLSVNVVESKTYSRTSLVRTNDLETMLMDFYTRFLRTAANWDADHMDMIIMWHSAYMSMCADFDLLERAIGREGDHLSPEDQLAVVTWANSPQAKRCVIHGTIIQKKLDNLPLGFEPAIHVPRAMFRAGIAWYCYTRYGDRCEDQGNLVQEELDFAEFKLVAVNPAGLLFQASGYKHGRPNTTEINATVCGLVDMLKRIGHWEIARRFAVILGALVHNEAP
jgi:hypothetical protein